MGFDPDSENRNTTFRKLEDPPIPEIGGDQQTLNTEQGGVWESVLEQLKAGTPQGTFAVFLKDTSLKLEEGVATVTTTRPHALEWLKIQMAPRIKKVLAAELAVRNEPMVSEIVYHFA